ncbi:MAG: FMN-binding protein [Candidatus Omnitrophota bacterium]
MGSNDKGKNGVIKMITALVAVGIFSGMTLVFIYNYSIPKIKVNVGAATDRAIRDIFPAADKVENAGMEDVYKASGADGEFLGYAFLAEGNGYQGVIQLIVGVNPDLTNLLGMEVLESQETPGLGAEIAGSGFKGQFNGLPITHAIEYVKNRKPQEPYQIEAITGATISSRAVVNILNKRIEEIRGILGTGQNGSDLARRNSTDAI